MSKANQFASELAKLCNASWYCVKPMDTFRDGTTANYFMELIIGNHEYICFVTPDPYEGTFPPVEYAHAKIMALELEA